MAKPNDPVRVPEWQSEVSKEHASDFNEKDVRELFGLWDDQIVMLAKERGHWFVCRIGAPDARRADYWFVRCVDLLEGKFEVSNKHRWVSDWAESLGKQPQEIK